MPTTQMIADIEERAIELAEQLAFVSKDMQAEADRDYVGSLLLNLQKLSREISFATEILAIVYDIPEFKTER